jgi:4-cresol dehydrogenase (hydroxylating)
VANGYRHGIGPNLTELFLQSNLGVVVGATVALRPPREARVAFRASLRPGGDMPAFVEALAQAKRELGLSSIVHVADRERTLVTLAPMVRARAKAHGYELSREEAEALVARVLSPGWNALGLVEGTRAQVRVTVRALRHRLRPYGRVRLMRRERLARMARIARALGLGRMALVAESAHEMAGLAMGRPTDGPLRSVHWAFHDDEPEWREPERGRAGWAVVAPLFPLRQPDIAAVRASVREVTERHSVQCAMTINLIADSVAQALITMGWRLEDEEARDRVHLCQRELTRELLDRGYPPYRAALGEMEVVTREGDQFWDVARQLKRTLDPHGVIAPGRYIPCQPDTAVDARPRPAIHADAP